MTYLREVLFFPLSFYISKCLIACFGWKLKWKLSDFIFLQLQAPFFPWCHFSLNLCPQLPRQPLPLSCPPFCSFTDFFFFKFQSVCSSLLALAFSPLICWGCDFTIRFRYSLTSSFFLCFVTLVFHFGRRKKRLWDSLFLPQSLGSTFVLIFKFLFFLGVHKYFPTIWAVNLHMCVHRWEWIHVLVCVHVCARICARVWIHVLSFQVRNCVISYLLCRSRHSRNAGCLLACVCSATFQSLAPGPETVSTGGECPSPLWR